MTERLQQQRGFADARVSSQQYHPAFHQAAAQHAVKLSYATGITRLFPVLHLAQILNLTRFRHRREARRSSLGHCLDERVPCLAMRALTLPFEGLAPAFRTGIGRFGFSHLLEELSPCRHYRRAGKCKIGANEYQQHSTPFGRRARSSHESCNIARKILESSRDQASSRRSLTSSRSSCDFP